MHDFSDYCESGRIVQIILFTGFNAITLVVHIFKHVREELRERRLLFNALRRFVRFFAGRSARLEQVG